MAISERIRAVEPVLDVPGAAADGELVATLVEMEKVQALVDLQVAAVTAECDRRMLSVDEGMVSTGTWLAEKCDVPKAVGQARVRTSRALQHMTATVAAAEAGEISSVKVGLLARSRKVKLAAEFDAHEPTLVAEAKRLTADDLARYLRRWEQLAHDHLQTEGDLAPEIREAPTEVHLSQTFGGRWTMTADLTAEDGAILSSVLAHHTDALFHAGAKTADGEVFTPSQRRGAAVVEIFRLGATDDPERSGAHPLILALVDIETLMGPSPRSRQAAGVTRLPGTAPPADAPGQPAAATGVEDHQCCSDQPSHAPPGEARSGEPGDPLDRRPVCEIDGAGPVTPAMIQRLACDGAIRRCVVDAKGEPLELGRSRRLATAAQRAALVVRDRGCVFPGCDRPSRYCQCHHTPPFDEGGATDVDAMCLLCSHHHHLMHEGRWTLERVGQHWVATSPTGLRRSQLRRWAGDTPPETIRPEAG